LYVHTHWDREWYLPFQGFQSFLVDVARRIVRDLRSGQLSHFYFDGQSVVFEDILEIHPEFESEFKALMAEGKLSAGPWYVLADQMLVGGESLVRNLHVGMKETRKYGEPSKIGYCPDTFGHSQDLPRILSGFGILSCVIWRGVPKIDSPVFWWQSPDGSRVLAYHLTKGYCQTDFHDFAPATLRGDEQQEMVNKLRDALLPWVEIGAGENGHISPYCSLVDGALHPVGADHAAPPPEFANSVERVNSSFARESLPLKAVPCSLTEFLERVQTSVEKHKVRVGLLAGEMRDNSASGQYARGYLLYGVLSTRLYLKRANRLAEYRLTRLIEPSLSHLFLRSIMPYPTEEISFTWKLLLKNHPHDSICGCSVDQVHEEMMLRSKGVDQLLLAIERAAENALSGKAESERVSPRDPDFSASALRVYNAANQSVSAPVPFTWFVKPGERLAGGDHVQIEKRKWCDQLFAGWGAVPYYKAVDCVEGWLWAEDVPAHGSRALTWPLPKSTPRQPDPEPSARAHGKTLSNGLLHLTVEGDGTLVVTTTLPGRAVHSYRLGHKLRDTADGGDSYNYDPIARDKPIYASFESAAIKRKGPLVSTLSLTYAIDIPCGLTFPEKSKTPLNKPVPFKRSKKRILHKVTTEVSLHRGLPIVFFNTTWVNESSDHRLEVVFETGGAVHASYSENHFSLVRRSHHPVARAKGGACELPVEDGQEAVPDRFPCQRFFIANGQLFLNTGLPEYGIERSFATGTILRAVSYLSRPRLRTRGGGAGPNIFVPGANCLGENVASYGWAPLSVPKRASSPELLTDELVVEAYALAEQYEGSLWPLLERDKGRSSQAEDRLFVLDNKAVRVVAQFVEDDGKVFVVRLLNVAQSKQKVRIKADFKFDEAALCWLNLDSISKVKFQDQTAEVAFGANELKTLRFDLP
jgi:hypothetical protein